MPVFRIVLATTNQGKYEEIIDVLGERPWKLLSLNDFPDSKPVLENGKSFDENALIKAREAFGITGFPALADDSGLMVDHLNGEPGVYSARFAGPGAGDEQNNRKLLGLLKGLPAGKRTARFHCSVALADESGEHLCRGEVEGIILEEPRGRNGFGYDPLFYFPVMKKTFAEMEREDKNRISHRGRAFLAMAEWMQNHGYGA